MRIATPCSRTNWSMICCPVIPCSASPTTCWCIAGLTVQVKSAARPHHDQPAERDDHPAVPHPPHERVDGEPEHRLLGAVHHAAEDDVQVLAQIAPDADLAGRLERRPAEPVHVLALLRREYAEP